MTVGVELAPFDHVDPSYLKFLETAVECER